MLRPAYVLLVEDNPDDVMQVSRVLKSCGLLEELVVARDGREAIDLLAGEVERRARLPDLIVLDLSLPRVSGLELLLWIRADTRLGDIPVVVLTGAIEDGQLLRLHRLGVLGYLVKPLRAPEFTRIVAGRCFPQPHWRGVGR